NKRKYPRTKLRLNGMDIQEADHVKYLVLIMDSKMTYQHHINYVYGKASMKLGYLTFLRSYKGIRLSLSSIIGVCMRILEWSSGIAQTTTQHDPKIAMCKILGVMNSTAYNTLNVISQLPPLELRRQQEEVNLLQKFVRWCNKFPEHNLTMVYQLWQRNREIKDNEKFVCSEKLSTLYRTYIHMSEIGMPRVSPDEMTHYDKPPNQIARLPRTRKSPFEKWSEPTQEQILASLDGKTIVIFADGSTKPEPGLGGTGLVIQDPSFHQWIELEFPIKGITTMIASEIESIRQH
ncbi:hypothetical protein RFI_40045, partial [Reticulomyxa filosa]